MAGRRDAQEPAQRTRLQRITQHIGAQATPRGPRSGFRDLPWRLRHGSRSRPSCGNQRGGFEQLVLRKHSHPAVSTPACAITWTKFPLEAAGTACPATSTSVSDSELTQTGSGLDNVLDEEASLKGRLARLELEVDQLKQEKVSDHGGKDLSSRAWGLNMRSSIPRFFWVIADTAFVFWPI